jgi:biopolymer transport protein ExbD
MYVLKAIKEVGFSRVSLVTQWRYVVGGKW